MRQRRDAGRVVRREHLDGNHQHDNLEGLAFGLRNGLSYSGFVSRYCLFHTFFGHYPKWGSALLPHFPWPHKLPAGSASRLCRFSQC
jgi:hypothetical protein